LQVLNDPGQELPLRLRVHMILDICRGMTFLHSNKPPIIHRDLKSPNLLVTQDYSLKVR
jgi:serine/threonine-protein kinase CTR1